FYPPSYDLRSSSELEAFFCDAFFHRLVSQRHTKACKRVMRRLMEKRQKLILAELVNYLKTCNRSGSASPPSKTKLAQLQALVEEDAGLADLANWFEKQTCTTARSATNEETSSKANSTSAQPAELQPAAIITYREREVIGKFLEKNNFAPLGGGNYSASTATSSNSSVVDSSSSSAQQADGQSSSAVGSSSCSNSNLSTSCTNA
ncbi:unnamed protein product, partial [Amoebophrya sp. A120]